MTAEQRSRVLVTGGSGFIGQRLVRALLESGAEVTVADLREPTEPGVHAVVGDLRDKFRDAFTGWLEIDQAT